MDLTSLGGEFALLAVAVMLTAALYATSGHGGATGYLAVFGLAGVAPALMRPLALVLNVVVAGQGGLRLWRAGAMPWRTLGILLVGSVPGTFLGATLTLPATTYRGLLGAMLLLAALRLMKNTTAEPSPTTPIVDAAVPAAALLMVVGLLLGVLSGLTGIGGGIFLSPILVLARLENPRRTAGAAAAFIVVNSVTGLVALASRDGLAGLPVTSTVLLGAAVLVGGSVGTVLAAQRLSFRGLRVALGVVLLFSGIKLLSEALL